MPKASNRCGLYVHLPFCVRKCRYCDFPSWPDLNSLIPDYIDALMREAQILAACYSDLVIQTVFLGGGTPSLLPASELYRLCTGLASAFGISKNDSIEWTAEANPGTLRSDWLQTAVECGINRISLGMQASQPHLLNVLGRIHTFDDVQKSAEMIRSAGIVNYNLDLMFGLPKQSPAHWEKSLRDALALSPAHLSCYGLIPEPGTPLNDDLDSGRLSLPEETEEREMYEQALNISSEAGMRQYEISNFALPGYECKHNIGYWDLTWYIGLGASAASMLPAKENEIAYIRTVNPSQPKSYIRDISKSDLPVWISKDKITQQTSQFEAVMLGLRMTQGVTEKAFFDRFGISLNDRFGEKLHKLQEDGLLVLSDGSLKLTRRGMDIQNSILVELMDDL